MVQTLKNFRRSTDSYMEEGAVGKSVLLGHMSGVVFILASGCSCASQKPVASHVAVAAETSIMINGSPIICDYEAYNCPGYRGKYKEKRLKTCKDVKTVWQTCPDDPHDLDRDGDGRPCENDCGTIPKR